MEKWAGSLAILMSIAIVNANSSKFDLVKSYNASGYGYFLEFTDLLEKYKPLNFGIGAPDFSPPKKLQYALANASTSDNYQLSQYSSSQGHPRLRRAVASLFSKLTNRTLNIDDNVVITTGATQALYAIFNAHTIPGDEWIVFEPYFHWFDPLIKAADGVPRYITLVANKTTGNVTSSDFKFDKRHLAKLFNKKTKGILLNTPHNPTGKMFDYEELAFIAELARKWNVIVVFDEVYQFMNYDGKEHLRLATFPGMFERTICVGSAGKMFSATGYRIGWVYGPKNLITNIKTVSSIMVYTVPTPTQEAVAVVMEDETENYGKPDSYIEQFKRESELKRNRIYNILTEAGMKPIFTESGYFTMSDWTSMIDYNEMDREINENADYSFVRWLIKNINIYALPLSHAYGDNKHIEQRYVRFTTIKRDETLEELSRLLKKWKSGRA